MRARRPHRLALLPLRALLERRPWMQFAVYIGDFAALASGRRELFFSQAVAGARALALALKKRGLQDVLDLDVLDDFAIMRFFLFNFLC